jgi:hypothetical protein
MVAQTVKVVAGLSKGAYVWAKYGFVAVNKSEMQGILKRAQAQLTNKQYKRAEAIFNHYYTIKK